MLIGGIIGIVKCVQTCPFNRKAYIHLGGYDLLIFIVLIWNSATMDSGTTSNTAGCLSLMSQATYMKRNICRNLFQG